MEADPEVTLWGGEGKEREGEGDAAQQELIPLYLWEITKNSRSRVILMEVQGSWGISPLTPQSCPWWRAAGWAFSLPHVLLALCIVPVAEPQLFVTAVSGV